MAERACAPTASASNKVFCVVSLRFSSCSLAQRDCSATDSASYEVLVTSERFCSCCLAAFDCSAILFETSSRSTVFIISGALLPLSSWRRAHSACDTAASWVSTSGISQKCSSSISSISGLSHAGVSTSFPCSSIRSCASAGSSRTLSGLVSSLARADCSRTSITEDPPGPGWPPRPSSVFTTLRMPDEAGIIMETGVCAGTSLPRISASSFVFDVQ